MKKIIASAVVAAATLSASQAAVFNGYSAGVSGGINNSRVKIKTTVPFFKKNTSSTKGVFGVHFDYDRSNANSFYWGLGLDLMFYSGKTRHTLASGNLTQGGFTFNGKATYERNRRWHSELDARLGYNFANQAAVYALAGLRLLSFKDSFKLSANVSGPAGSAITTGTYRSSELNLIPVVGAGVKAKVANNVSAGVEYRYSIESYNKVNRDFKVKQDGHQVLAKVSYHF